jgi:uncharacterized lipoprotein YmbA
VCLAQSKALGKNLEQTLVRGHRVLIIVSSGSSRMSTAVTESWSAALNSALSSRLSRHMKDCIQRWARAAIEAKVTVPILLLGHPDQSV